MPATIGIDHAVPMDSMGKQTGYRALRKGRTSIPGQLYLITTVCDGRRKFFLDGATAHAVAKTMAEPRLWRDSTLLCWVLMPDHVHLLVRLGATEPLSKLMQRAKAVTARAANHANPPAHRRIWMPGFHDRALRRDEDARSVARYVVGNPLRAGLADALGEYPFWDAVWLRSDAGLLSLA